MKAPRCTGLEPEQCGGARHLTGLLLILGVGSASAQVVLDGKFGPSGALAGPKYDVTAELGTTRGNNLFHSFAQFDLQTGDTANFSGPAHIQNILSRVTSGNPSSIDGTIRSSIHGANFFFINPAGVVFGPNAAVDVGGAFAVSTANYLKLADDARFVASLDADDSLLSSAPVAAFGFLEGASGALEVQGALASAPNSPLSVIGSTVVVADGASLSALGSQINLTGVSTPGEVTPALSPSINPGPGPGAEPPAQPPGSVVIRGGRLVVDNAQVHAVNTGGNVQLMLTDSVEVLNGAQVITANAGPTKGGDILVDTPSLLMDGLDGPLPTRIAAETYGEDASGAGGNIQVRSDATVLQRGAEISVSTFGVADAGRVDIVTGSLHLQGSEFPQYVTQISANAAPSSGSASGAGGQIAINTDSLVLDLAVISASTLGDANAGSIDLHAGTIHLNNSSITTYSSGAGNGGDIRIQSAELTLDGPFASITALALGVNSQLPAGRGGVINIQSDALTLLNDSAISASSYGDGAGGNINIRTGTLLLDTGNPQPGVTPGISASSNPSFDGTETAGPGGDIVIESDSLTLRNGMLISTTTSTPGPGGNIQIRTGSANLSSQSSIQSASLGAGPAGTLSIESAGDVHLTGNSSISTSAPDSSGGDIQVLAGNEIRLDNSAISAQAGPGGGGSISVLAPSLTYLLDSRLDAQAVGDGGNLTVETDSFIINRSGLISKSSSANGGNITILSDVFLQSDSIIDASAPFGLPGTVEVTAPQVDLSGSLVGLPANLLDAESLLRPDCAVRLSGNVSSFVILGRGGLPLEPGGFLPSSVTPSRDETP